jgi:hypothetical protein
MQPKNMHVLFHKDIIQAGGALIIYYGISLSDVNEVGKFIATALTISYVIWKWARESKDK